MKKRCKALGEVVRRCVRCLRRRSGLFALHMIMVQTNRRRAAAARVKARQVPAVRWTRSAGTRASPRPRCSAVQHEIVIGEACFQRVAQDLLEAASASPAKSVTPMSSAFCTCGSRSLEQAMVPETWKAANALDAALAKGRGVIQRGKNWLIARRQA